MQIFHNALLNTRPFIYFLFDTWIPVSMQQALNGDDSIYRNLTEKWEHATPISFQYQRDTERSKQISREIRKFYFNDEPVSLKNGHNLGLVSCFTSANIM